MFKTQQIELMALLVFVLMANTVPLKTSEPVVKAATEENVTQSGFSGINKTLVELSQDGLIYNQVTYPLNSIDSLVSLLKEEGKTNVVIHSTLSSIQVVNSLNAKLQSKGGELSI